MSRARYAIDPRDPRAPSQEAWDQLSAEERARIVAELPSEISRAEPPEGDAHRIPKTSALEALDAHFRRIRRRMYVSSELPVYYPAEAMFAPDLIAVADVDPHPRDSWVVSHEQRGLDLALEIHVSGRRRKDVEQNVERYARLGIPEYFSFDAPRRRLLGWRLPDPAARRYEPIVPQEGQWWSRVLELGLSVEDGRLRFLYGNSPVLDARELIARLSGMVDQAMARAEEEAARAERLAARLRELGVDPDDVD